MSRKLKILHTCETAMGGVGVYQKNLAGMDMGVLEQLFLIPQPHAGIMKGDPRVVTYPLERRGAWAVFRQIRALALLIRSECPDVVVFHSTFSLFALLAMRLLWLGRSRPRMLYFAHGWAADQYGVGVKASCVRVIEGRLCGFADLIVNISRNDLQTARKYNYSGDHVLIENAVPDRESVVRYECFSNEPDEIHLLFVGRFDRQKGLDILLEAFALASDTRPDIRLHLIGSAVRSATYSTLPEGVDLIGWVQSDEIDQWYGSADVQIVPSRWEGLPLVIPEALRNGTPVITSRRSGMEDLFEEGRQGMSFDLSVEDLADLLISLDREFLRGMRPACRALYETRYSIVRLHAEILRAYRGDSICDSDMP